MYRYFLIFALLFVFFGSLANGQVKVGGGIELDKKSFDFGDILVGNQRLVEYKISNTGSDDNFVLRWEAPEDCIVKMSSLKIKSGESILLRVKFNPREKGFQKRIVKVYLASLSKPIDFVLEGNVKYIDRSEDQNCPDFKQTTEEKQVNLDFTVQVIDKATNLPIPKARVSFEPKPNFGAEKLTGKDGTTTQNVPIDLYDINVTATGYIPGSQSLYIGKSTTSTIFLLEKNPELVQNTPDEEKEIPEDNHPKPGIKKDTVSQPRRKLPDITGIIKKDIDKLKPKPKKTDSTIVVKEKPGELPVDKYSYNNIVFLIDVSTSMSTPDKLPLLKIAMKNLLGSLRAGDKLSIVTYASGVKTLMNGVEVQDKDAIDAIIDKMIAHGNTEGGKGIREAYKIAEENFVSNGNNQIILATDGDFNLDKSDDALYRFIRQKAEKGTILSVIGFGRLPRAIKKMKEIADKGNGSFIYVTNTYEANGSLTAEIKQRSLKK